MPGTIVLQGGGAFVANDELDAELLRQAGSERVVMLPTADAYEHPERLVAAAMSWGERLDAAVEALMVLRRGEAMQPEVAARVDGAHVVYLVGDQPLHLRSVLKDTPLWAAIVGVLDAGGVVVGCGGSADALCDPMIDPRGGAFTLGLGLVSGLALVTDAQAWSGERLHRTLKLANTPVAELAAGTALVRTDGGWREHGPVVVHGVLP